MKKLLVIAFNTEVYVTTTRHSCVLDIAPVVRLSHIVKSQSWGTIMCYDKEGWKSACGDWKRINRAEFEALYGEIRYP